MNKNIDKVTGEEISKQQATLNDTAYKKSIAKMQPYVAGDNPLEKNESYLHPSYIDENGKQFPLPNHNERRLIERGGKISGNNRVTRNSDMRLIGQRSQRQRMRRLEK